MVGEFQQTIGDFLDKIITLSKNDSFFAIIGIIAEFFFFVWVHTIFHEIGHFLVLTAFHDKPRLVRICSTDLLCGGKTIFRIAPVPGGFCGHPARPRALQPTPLRQILVSLGGLGVTAAFPLATLLAAKITILKVKVHLALFAVAGLLILFENIFGDNLDGPRLLFAVSHLFKGKTWPKELPRAARRWPIATVMKAIRVVILTLLGLYLAARAFLWTF